MVNHVLVTGGSGFLGLRIVAELLKQGYVVRTTLRSLKKQPQVLDALNENGVPTENLSFVVADLSSDENWEAAMEDVDVVTSVASPMFFGKVKDENEVIRPALEGIQRVLKFADDAEVKRVVMTSNFGAVGFSNLDQSSVTTEADWTQENQPGLSVYEKSKLLAEKAAWQFMENSETDMELVTINPVAIFGPSLDEHMSGSFETIKYMTNGAGRLPNIALNVVDVRDVAAIHILAMKVEEAAGKRFIVSADGKITMPEIAQLLKAQRPEVSESVSTHVMPDFVLKMSALFSKRAKEAKLLLEINRNISNQQAKEVLGWTPIADQETAILNATDSLKKYNLI